MVWLYRSPIPWWGGGGNFLVYTILLRYSGRAVYLYSTAHKTQLTILQLEDFLHTSLFPDLLPQPIGGFINNIFRGFNATTYVRGQPWHETDRATHLVEHSSVDFKGDIDIYNLYINHVQRNKKTK